MVYGYARVSTTGQKRDGNSLEEQQEKLKENGAAVIFVDVFTGTKTDRPEFKKLLSLLKSGDTVMATKLDRVSRSASQGIALVDDLLSRGITLHILNMGVMNNTPMGKLIRNVMFSFAEFERDMIVERTTEGKNVKRRIDKEFKEGRPKVEISIEEFKKFEKMKKEGLMSLEECCKKLNISQKTWYNKRKEFNHV